MPDKPFRMAGWPTYREANPRARELALLAGEPDGPWQLTREDRSTATCATPGELARAIVTERLDVYVADVAAWYWLIELDNEADGCSFQAACTKQNIVGYRVRSRGDRRGGWIGGIGVWNLPFAWESLAELRQLYQHLNIGVYATPGGLGDRLARLVWEWSGLPRVTRPHATAREAILKYGTGGRVDAPQAATREHSFAELFEVDMHAAYPTMIAWGAPAGLQVRILPCEDGNPDPAIDACAMYFCECEVRIDAPLSIGPFPVRSDGRTTTYPTHPGAYHAWLWSCEVDSARESGCTVRLLQGWGWTEKTTGLALWADLLDHYRRTAPNPFVATAVKLIGVAFLGRQGIAAESYSVQPESACVEGDYPVLAADGTGTELVIRAKESINKPALTHWFGWVLAATRVELYKLMRQYEAAGIEVIASNYDAVYLGGRPPPVTSRCRLNTIPLHNARLPYARGLISDEKVTLPGLMAAREAFGIGKAD